MRGKGGKTYPAGWSESAVDIEKTDGILDGTGLERGVDACSFGHIYRTRTGGGCGRNDDGIGRKLEL